MNYIQVQVNDTNTEQRELLIALLANVDFESFEETDTVLKAFIKETEFDQITLDKTINSLNLNYTSTIIPPLNWNAQWESSFEPIIVNDFAHRAPWVGIRAAFHQQVPHVKHEIIITPKMSFGTGHHATTYMMIEQMEALDFTGKSVADFGTGTGVLAILAEKLGAISIDAIDNDDWSIENSIENVAANNCSNINLIKDTSIPTGLVYDIILANINLHVILANSQAIQAACKKGTQLLLSGFIKSDEAEMLQMLAANGIKPLKTSQKADWICILAQMN